LRNQARDLALIGMAVLLTAVVADEAWQWLSPFL
jgi:hypothetical protein